MTSPNPDPRLTFEIKIDDAGVFARVRGHKTWAEFDSHADAEQFLRYIFLLTHSGTKLMLDKRDDKWGDPLAIRILGGGEPQGYIGVEPGQSDVDE